ncbi:probable transcription factor At4g00390 [Rhododendron vialii]|uniref:probable transcription factor At4g00390 n=1 Tax=Rhododendron vialii TaxID=182163 RepID=UPI00265DF82D|nr:probable transcription factor At4g00390 [Rhododendron vialii]
MAPNRLPESEAQQHESSSEEEEEEEEEEDSGSSSEEETHSQPQHNNNINTSTPKKPQPTPNSSAPKKPQPTPNSSDSDSEYESDSDSPPTASTHRPDPNIKPITSKPMDDPPKSTKRPRSDPTPSTPVAKSSAAAAVKRTAAESESNGAQDSKRAKKKQKEKDVAAVINNSNETTPSKQMFQRLWSEDDEIVILKGLIDFRAKKGYDPMTDLNVFHDFIKKSLHLGDVSKSQFSTKVRRMKKKFENNVKRGKDGQDRSFSNPHEQRAYNLSKKIWGEDSDGFGVGNAKKVNGKGRKNEKSLSVVDEELSGRVEEGARREVEPNAGAERAIGFDLSIEEVVVKDGLELLSGSNKLEMMEKWRQFRVEEVELYLKRLELVREQGKLVLEAMKKSTGH